jgi:hypothetical protein
MKHYRMGFFVLLGSWLVQACGTGEPGMARFGGEREASISVDFDNSTGRELLSGTSEQLLVTAASALYCPEGFSYSASARLCVNAEEALGPFTEAMVADCKRFGGGDSCDNLTWERNFAQNLRGNAECPKGASRTLGGLCVEGGARLRSLLAAAGRDLSAQFRRSGMLDYALESKLCGEYGARRAALDRSLLLPTQ